MKSRYAKYLGAAAILFAGGISLNAGGVVGFLATAVAGVGLGIVLEAKR